MLKDRLMKRRMLSIVLLSLAFLASAGNLVAHAEQRTVIDVLQYSPRSQSDIREQFVSVLREKLAQLPQELDSLTPDERNRLAAMNVDDKDTQTQPSLTLLAHRWKDSNLVLMIMYGTIFTVQGAKAPTIDSTIYVGQNDRLFTTEDERVDLPLDVNTANDFKDSHTLMLLYALAKDAHSQGKQPAVVDAYLSKALSISGDLAKNNPGARMLTLHKEIQTILNQLERENTQVK
jgi:predicted ribosome quality control (RQC) complex YloA/Tae2 family protein